MGISEEQVLLKLQSLQQVGDEAGYLGTYLGIFAPQIPGYLLRYSQRGPPVAWKSRKPTKSTTSSAPTEELLLVVPAILWKDTTFLEVCEQSQDWQMPNSFYSLHRQVFGPKNKVPTSPPPRRTTFEPLQQHHGLESRRPRGCYQWWARDPHARCSHKGQSTSRAGPAGRAAATQPRSHAADNGAHWAVVNVRPLSPVQCLPAVNAISACSNIRPEHHFGSSAHWWLSVRSAAYIGFRRSGAS